LSAHELSQAEAASTTGIRLGVGVYHIGSAPVATRRAK